MALSIEKSITKSRLKVEYSLTEEGKSLREILVAMSVWGEERIEKQKASGEEVTLLHTHGGYLNYLSLIHI